MALDLSLFVHAVMVLALSALLVFSLYQRSRAKDAQRTFEASNTVDGTGRSFQDTARDGSQG